MVSLKRNYLVKTEEVEIAITHEDHFSLGTSPYYAHQNGLALDIYNDFSLSCREVSSPVSGKIIKIKSLLAPKAKFTDGVDEEFLILIENQKNKEIVYKILHVKPKVKVGETIEIGESLGTTIRNGYFAYWSSPHLHLEIRKYYDAVRARGGNPISLFFNENQKSINRRVLDSSDSIKNVPLKIQYSFPEFILGYLPDSYYQNIPPFYGITSRVKDINCIIDGGIPIYKNGVIIFPYISKGFSNDDVKLGKIKIGKLEKTRKRFGFLKFEKTRFFINNQEIRGISLFIANKKPLIKFIPFHINEFSFKRNSTQYLSLRKG